ncbi:MAG TPA: hypothetical protein VNT75_25365, partial [Symbiobacteriaceae bacterium]|nr:hypothetical protein [Symbiobacteriaceae bacterium]
QIAQTVRSIVSEFPGHSWLGAAPSPVLPGPLDADQLHEIATPTLVLNGERDLPDFLRIGEKLAAEIPGAQRQGIPGAGHLLPVEQPERFTAAVLRFLDALERW